MVKHSLRGKKADSVSQSQQDGKQPFMGRMLDRLSKPFVRIGSYFVDKIMLGLMNEIARAERNSDSDLRFLNLERHRRTGR